MVNDSIKITGDVRIDIIGADGAIKDSREIKNLVVTTGKNYIASRMKDATATAMTHMELGTGTTAAAVGDTALQTAISGSRVTLTSTTVTTNAVAYVASFPAGTGTGAITEAGILNAGATGNMLCRTVFGVVTKASGDTVVITWNVTVA
jgi:hypothetical protein